jgi:hypothetical protein
MKNGTYVHPLHKQNLFGIFGKKKRFLVCTVNRRSLDLAIAYCYNWVGGPLLVLIPHLTDSIIPE